jgi:AraC-like DNA-binding protein
MLFHLCGYIVEEAIEKQTYKAILSGDSLSGTGLFAGVGRENEAPVKRLESIKQGINEALTNTLISSGIEAEDAREISPAGVLAPAFKYIKEHKSEHHTVKELAALCHISEGYFSKLFTKSTGESYSSWLLKKRISWAKDLLASTDLTVQEIAEDIGFSDAGHFVRTFKKYEGITPGRYQKILSDKMINA